VSDVATKHKGGDDRRKPHAEREQHKRAPELVEPETTHNKRELVEQPERDKRELVEPDAPATAREHVDAALALRLRIAYWRWPHLAKRKAEEG
jgi:hypothetical protein